MKKFCDVQVTFFVSRKVLHSCIFVRVWNYVSRVPIQNRANLRVNRNFIQSGVLLNFNLVSICMRHFFQIPKVFVNTRKIYANNMYESWRYLYKLLAWIKSIITISKFDRLHRINQCETETFSLQYRFLKLEYRKSPMFQILRYVKYKTIEIGL